MGMLFQSLSQLFITILNVRTESADDKDTSKPNPSKDGESDKNLCKVYSIELSEENKNLKGIQAKQTDVFKEAQANGLVPIEIRTIFASPASAGVLHRLPDSLNKVLIVLDQQDSKATGYADGQTYTFLGGTVADLMSNDKDKDKDDKDKDDKDKDKENTTKPGKPGPSGDSSSPPPKPNQLKANKLIPRMGAENLRLPPANLKDMQDRDEASESLLMPKDE